VIEIRALREADRPWVTEQLTQRWGSPVMVTRGQIFDGPMLPGLIATEDTIPCGLLLYHIEDGACEIVSLDSWREGRGIGTALLGAIQDLARQRNCTRLWLITTNDNLPAQAFYQKRGFHQAAVYPNAIEMARLFKPEIPAIGLNGIPITDEIEMEMTL
jgi:ribosomal protein S18 acetylase RimI-like enzyme